MNRNKMILGAWVLGLLFPIEMMAKTSCTDNSTRLWYNAPAQQWLEALPIGNSHLVPAHSTQTRKYDSWYRWKNH